MKVMYISINEAENMRVHNRLWESPIQAQTVADRLNYEFDTDEFVVVRVEDPNYELTHGYTVVSTMTM